MPKKCCVYACQTNYKSKRDGEKLSVFRFPKNSDERKLWMQAVPNANLSVGNNTVICELHWPKTYEAIKVQGGNFRPKNPPSLWPGVPASQIPSTSKTKRTTKRALSSVRNEKPDELSLFLENDKLTFQTLKVKLLESKTELRYPITSFLLDKVLYVQSMKLQHGVPLFILKIYEDLHYEAFHAGVQCSLSTLSANRIDTVHSWSVFEEILRYLSVIELDNKKKIIFQHISSMGPKVVGKKIYSPEMIVRAFVYFATSRSLYQQLRVDYQLPSVRTLTRITSKVSQLDEKKYLELLFDNVQDHQKLCVVFHDEIYIKKMLLYHGGTVFGQSADNPSALAKTMLGVMILCLNGGPKILSKLVPVSKLQANFLYKELATTSQCIESAGASVSAIICDGNRVNQAFFKLFDTVPGKPWLTVDGKYLLYDFVHLLKNIRNLWLTEKTGELVFYENGVSKVAKWSVLKELFLLESKSLVKLSDLNETAVAPKPVERQRVSTCLQVFSEKTHSALLTHPALKRNDVEDTASFLKIVINWWKILNVKCCGVDVRFNDPFQAVVHDVNDSRLDFLLMFGDMALKMTSTPGKRVKQFSKDTAVALHHTCFGLVDLCKHLLCTTHSYVLFGQFTSDHLEKEYSKLRQGSGGAYFLAVQQILEKVSIKKASLLLKLNVDASSLSSQSGHHCMSCEYNMSEKDTEIFDGLTDLEYFIPEGVKMTLVYIAGFVTRYDEAPTENELLGHTKFYFEKYGKYTAALDRGMLKYPTDQACQWVFFCFVMFHSVKSCVCRKSLSNIFFLISEFYQFGMNERHCVVLSNVFLNRLCNESTPKSGKEPALKVLKLS